MKTCNCSDGYDADYYRQSPLEDPPGAPGASLRVDRGESCWERRSGRSQVRQR